MHPVNKFFFQTEISLAGPNFRQGGYVCHLAGTNFRQKGGYVGPTTSRIETLGFVSNVSKTWIDIA